jgi:hypothetical protein
MIQNLRTIFQPISRQQPETVLKAELVFLHVIGGKLTPVSLHVAADEAGKSVT